MLTTAQKIARIQAALAARGRPSGTADIASILGTDAATVWRWAKGQTQPRAKQAEAIEILYRSLVKAEEGDPGAERIVGAVLGGTGMALLGLGFGAVLIAAGLGWLLGEFVEKETKQKKKNEKGDHSA